MKLIQNTKLVVLCGLFTSCIQWGSNENNRLMQQAELLVELAPDSALILLDSVNIAVFTEADKAEYTLLRV